MLQLIRLKQERIKNLTERDKLTNAYLYIITNPKIPYRYRMKLQNNIFDDKEVCWLLGTFTNTTISNIHDLMQHIESINYLNKIFFSSQMRQIDSRIHNLFKTRKAMNPNTRMKNVRGKRNLNHHRILQQAKQQKSILLY
jgi:hypothetical protein